VEALVVPFEHQRELIMTMPGIDRSVAEGLIAEIGVDMSRFPTAGHLASWAGMCPGQHESAGKSRSGRSRHGNPWLGRYLAVAAMAAARTKGTYFFAQYSRLVRTRGKAKARKAVGHSMLVAVWHMLNDDVPYADLGEDWYERRNDPARRARRHLADLRSLGWAVDETPDGVVLTPPQAA